MAGTRTWVWIAQGTSVELLQDQANRFLEALADHGGNVVATHHTASPMTDGWARWSICIIYQGPDTPILLDVDAATSVTPPVAPPPSPIDEDNSDPGNSNPK